MARGRISRTIERMIVYGARTFAVAVGLIVGTVTTVEFMDSTIVIEEISVPSELAQQGYTPSVTAYEILKEWRNVDSVATTTKRRREIGFNRGQVELSLPGFNVTIGSIVDYFKTKLGVSKERLRGGIVATTSLEPGCEEGCYIFLLSLDGRRPEQFAVKRPKSEIDGLIREAARGAVEKLDPYLLANFHYARGEPTPTPRTRARPPERN